MLGPHLTEANLVEVLARAKYRTKRELARLVCILDPLPEVPARIEPLGPASVGAPDYREERATVAAPERVDLTSLAAEGHGAALERPELYKVQFTATGEYVRLAVAPKRIASSSSAATSSNTGKPRSGTSRSGPLRTTSLGIRPGWGSSPLLPDSRTASSCAASAQYGMPGKLSVTLNTPCWPLDPCPVM